MTGRLERALSLVEMESEKITDSRRRKHCMEELHARVFHSIQSLASIEFAQVSWLWRVKLKPVKIFIVAYSFGVLSYFSFILDQCCSTNGLPDECLGLCMEDEDTSIAERSAFTSICDKYQSTVVKCTVEGGGIRFNWEYQNSLLYNPRVPILAY